MINSPIYRLVEVSSIISFAETLPLECVALPNNEPLYPVTTGERLASYILHLIQMEDWPEEGRALVDEIEEIIVQLDTGVDKPDAWRDLYDANAALKAYIRGRY